MSGRGYWLVGYDIASPRRLRRVHHYLKRRAFPVQYSLFVALLDEPGLNRLLQELARLIDPRQDDVRAWPVPERAEPDYFGRGLAEGIVLALGSHDKLPTVAGRVTRRAGGKRAL
jgi:CRISPR-associated protein Cas2